MRSSTHQSTCLYGLILIERELYDEANAALDTIDKSSTMPGMLITSRR